MQPEYVSFSELGSSRGKRTQAAFMRGLGIRCAREGGGNKGVCGGSWKCGLVNKAGL